MDIEPYVPDTSLDSNIITPGLDGLPAELVLHLVKYFDNYRDVERFSTLNRRIRGIVKSNRPCLAKGWINLEISRMDVYCKEVFCSCQNVRYDSSQRNYVKDGKRKYLSVYDKDSLETRLMQQRPVSEEFMKLLSLRFASMNINELYMWEAPRDVMDLIADLKREHMTTVHDLTIKFHRGCSLLPSPRTQANFVCDLVSSPDPSQTKYLLYFYDVSQIPEELFHMTEFKTSDKVEVCCEDFPNGQSPIRLSYELLSQYRATKLSIRCQTNLNDDDVYHIIKDVVMGIGRATFPDGWSIHAPFISMEAIMNRFPTATEYDARHPHPVYSNFPLYTIPCEVPEGSEGTYENVRKAKSAQRVFVYYTEGQVCINKKPVAGVGHWQW